MRPHPLSPALLLLLSVCGLAACGDKEGSETDPPLDDGDDTATTGDTAATGDDTGTPDPSSPGGLLTGSAMAVIGGGNFVMMNDAKVSFLDSSGTIQASTTTSDWGMFQLAGALQGRGSICVEAEGMETPVCTEPLVLGAAPLHVGAIEVPLPSPVAWGRVALPDGTSCTHRYPEFGVWVDATVSTSDGRTVQTNISGEYLLPGYSGPLTARCEGVTAVGEGGGSDTRSDLILTAAVGLKHRGPIQLTGRANYSAMRPPSGSAMVATLPAEVSEGGTLSVQWRAEGLEATGTKVAWSLPPGGQSARLWALVSDGLGSYTLTSARVMPDEPLVYAGQLLDTDGKPIVGAVVRVNGEETTTDAEGLYDLEVTKHAERYLLSVEHPDHTPCLQIQHDSWRGTVPDAVDASGLPCLRRLDTATFEALSGTTLKAGALSIPIPGGVMVDALGKAVSGSVEAAWYETAPGEPLAAEPMLLDKADGPPVYAETLGGLYLIFRNPSDPTQRYFLAKGGTISHSIPSSVTDSEKVSIATLNPETGRLETAAEAGAVTHSGASWGYAMPLDRDFFVPVYPLYDTGCVRVNVPRARFPGPLGLTASVPGSQSTLPQLINRPVNSDLVVIGGLPHNRPVTLYLFHVHPSQGQVLVESTVVIPNGKITSIQQIDGYPAFAVEPACVDVTLPSQAPQGQFLTRHLVTDVRHNNLLLLKPNAVGNLYYNAIDPLGEKTTLSDWLDSLDWPKASPHDLTGDEAMAIYGNAGDLGFGREMHLQIQQDPDGNGSATEPPVVAMYTVNYENVHHAAIGSAVAATVAMEFSPHPLSGGAYYTKFFVFDASGDRISHIALDDGGAKAVPDLCVNCHGGQPASESQFFSVDPIDDTVSLMHPYPDDGRLGDLARFIPFAVESFAYSPLFPRAAQEEDFRVLNEALLLTNLTDDARAMVHGWYDDELSHASDTLGTSGTLQDTAWYPTNKTGMNGIGGDWSGHADLYEQVYQPYCRSCHMSFDYTDFAESALFLGYAGLIQSYVCAAPTMMPQAQVTQQNLFSDGAALQQLIDSMSAHAKGSWSATTCPQ